MAAFIYQTLKSGLRTKRRLESSRGIAPDLQWSSRMKKAKQYELFKKDLRFFGGLLLLGKRKSKRPFSSKHPLHLVMRSSWAKAGHSFLQPQNKNAIANLIRKVARTYHVKVYQQAIAGNHIHLVILAPKLKNYQTFIRVLSSQIASHVMQNRSFLEFFESIQCQEKAKTGGDPHYPSRRPSSTRKAPSPNETLEPKGKEQQFWQMRPFTRLLYWGRDFQTACQYVTQNTLEALGFIKYKPRKKNRYHDWIEDSGPGDPPRARKKYRS